MIKRAKNIIRRLLYKKRIQEQKRQQKLQFERCKPWFRDNGDGALRLDYNLNANSIVFDLGGYKGEFARDIYNKFQPNIYVFEPIISFCNVINEAFYDIKKVRAYPYGLAGKNAEMQISLTDDASSIFIKSKNTETIQLKSIVEFIKSNNIEHIDLIKINIEGGEYEVLESLIENNMIYLFTDIQVQFHDFIIENAKERMQAIQNKLAKTHELTYQYEFVWENWTLKKE